MKKSLLFSVLLFIIVILTVITVFAIFSRTYIVSAPSPDARFDLVSLDYDDTVIENAAAFELDGKSYFVMSAVDPGSSDVRVRYTSEDGGENGPEYTFSDLKVSSLGILYQQSLAHDFQYWQLIFIAVGAYFLVLGIWFYRRFTEQKSINIYGYKPIFNFTLMLICVVFALMMLVYGVLLLTRFADQTASGALSLMGVYIVVAIGLTLPVMVVFFIAITLSNISLIRHEGFRPVNLLGSAVGLFITGAIVFFVLMTVKYFPDHKNSFIFKAVTNIGALGIFFLENLIISTSICTLICLKIAPDRNCDFLMILGCGFRKDGTLSPILRGRVDRAIDYYRTAESSGKPVRYIIPSGGKGTDECISESEAMTRYLLSKGIPADRIIKEDKSTTTYENMKFSEPMIHGMKPDAEVIFATSSFHVFRSGVYASQVGLNAAGIGSRTRWYFWPNAFMREVLGLLVAYWKYELAIGITASFFVVLITNLQSILQAIS